MQHKILISSFIISIGLLNLSSLHSQKGADFFQFAEGDSAVAELSIQQLYLVDDVEVVYSKPECLNCQIVPGNTVKYFDGDFYVEQPEALSIAEIFSGGKAVFDLLLNGGCKKDRDLLIKILLN